MLRVEKMIIAENKRIRREGRQEGIKEGINKVNKIIKEMKKQGIEVELIEKITGFTKEEINQIS